LLGNRRLPARPGPCRAARIAVGDALGSQPRSGVAATVGLDHHDRASATTDAVPHYRGNSMRLVTRSDRRRRPFAGLAAGLLLLGGLTACTDDAGEVQDDPEGALRDAVAALADHDGVELILAIDGDEEAIAAELGERETAILLDSSFTVRATGQTEDDAQAEALLDLAGEEAAEFRVLPQQRLFVRVDVDTVAAVVDDPEFDAFVDEAVGFADLVGLADVVGTLRAGGWVEVTGLEQLAALAGQQDEPTEEESADVQQRTVAALERFVAEDVTVEPLGSEDVGERVRATTTGADLQELLDELGTILADVGGVGAGDLQGIDDADLPPDETVTVDAWISDGVLTQLGYDLATTGDGAPAGTFLLMAIGEFTGSVEAPDDATPFDVFELVGGFLGGPDDLGGVEGDPADGGTTDDAEPGEDPFGGECLPEDVLDDIRAQASEEELAELEAAIDEGFIDVC
jgi:hypothetical protein